MKIRGTHIWIGAIIVAVVVIGITLHLWHRYGNQDEQTNSIFIPAGKKSSSTASQDFTKNRQDMSPNGHPVPPGSTGTAVIENIRMSSDVVKVWGKFLQNNPDERQISEFIASLSDDDLLILMEYFCSSNQIPAVEALIIPVLKQIWGKEVPFAKLLDIVSVQDQNNTFREILSNFVTVYGRDADLPTRDMIATRLMQIITDRDEAAGLRGSLILYLSGLLQVGVSMQTDYSDNFLNMLNNSSEDPKVVAASVTALRRLGDKRAVPILIKKCLSDSEYLSRDVARHIVVALAKYSKGQGVESPVDPIRQVMMSTQDDRVFGSSVYAISLLSTNDVYDALPDIMESLERHEEQQTCYDAVISALSKHKEAVLAALNDNNQEQIVAGLQACAIVSIPEAKERLHDLIEELPEYHAIIDIAMRKSELLEDDNPEWRQQLIEEKKNVD